MSPRLWLLLAIPALLSGCRAPAPAVPSPARVWPPSPAAPRIRFVASLGGPVDLGVSRSAWQRVVGWITGDDLGCAPFVKPQAVAVDELGNLCVADPGAGAVGYYDARTRRYHRWEKAGTNVFLNPVAVACRQGLLYVADSGRGQVLLLSAADGRPGGILSEGLERPVGLALRGEQVLVADAKRDCIAIFDRDGRRQGQFGTRGEGPGQFNMPTHVAVDGANRVIVTDAMNCRLQVFDADGRPLAVIGSRGDTSGHFSRPKGVAVDTAGHVYIVDALFDNVQVFDRSGRFLLPWGEAGTGPGEFWLPAGIAIDAANRIYVADAYNGRVQVFQYVGTE